MYTWNEIAQLLPGDIAPVVEFDPGSQRLVQMDFTASNTSLTAEIIADTSLFENYITAHLAKNYATYGIGGYGEHRTIYQRSELFDANDITEEPRRLHLGTDIWGKEYTRVYTPLEGIIHSTGFHVQRGDYGAVIIVEHQISGMIFYTLYGHLTLDSIHGKTAGDKVSKGQLIATFGQPHENGHWPPHLHFQLITDLQGRVGDYPGVCRYAERKDWLSRSPDPDILLRLNQYLTG